MKGGNSETHCPSFLLQQIFQTREDAEVVIIPLGDQELYEYDRKTANDMVYQGRKVVIVKMRKPEPLVPEIEFMLTRTG